MRRRGAEVAVAEQMALSAATACVSGSTIENARSYVGKLDTWVQRPAAKITLRKPPIAPVIRGWLVRPRTAIIIASRPKGGAKRHGEQCYVAEHAAVHAGAR